MRRGSLVFAVVLATALPACLPALAAQASSDVASTQVPAPAGVSGLEASDPAISADGRWIAFVGEVDGVSGLYRHDTATGETERVQTRRGAPIEGEMVDPSISDDGRMIAWTLVPRDPAVASQVWLSDLRTDSTRLVSGTLEWEPGNAASSQPEVSGDGKHVAFTTRATDIIAKPRWGAGSAPGADVVVAERVDEGFVITLVSTGESGVDFGSPTINRDATKVAFTATRGARQWVQVAERRGGAWSPGSDEAALLPSRASSSVLSADGDAVLYSQAHRSSHVLIVGEVLSGDSRTVAKRVDAAAGFDLSADADASVHVVDGTLVLTDLGPSPAAEAPRTPVAVEVPEVRRAGPVSRGRGYLLRAVPATWTGGAGGRIERQWLRDGYAVPGATGATYRVKPADLGREIAVLERVVVTGGAVGEAVSAAHRPGRDRARIVLPRKVWRTRPGSKRLRVRVVTAAPGGSASGPEVVPQGRVRVTVRGRTITRSVGRRGWATVRLPRQRPGRHVVRVRHVGTPYVAPAAPKKLRLVVRRGR